MRPISSDDRFGRQVPTCLVEPDRSYRGRMGFNPQRKMTKTPADYAMVIGAVAVCVLLLVWAFFG